MATPIKQLNSSLFVAGQINVGDLDTIESLGIKTIINNRPDNEEASQPPYALIAAAAKERGIDYHFLPMANGQPLAENIISDFKNVIDNAQAPVLAHCRSGMRSSFVWALGGITAGELSVDEAIEAATSAGIPLANQRAILESIA